MINTLKEEEITVSGVKLKDMTLYGLHSVRHHHNMAHADITEHQAALEGDRRRAAAYVMAVTKELNRRGE